MFPGNEQRLSPGGNYQPIEDKNNQWFGATVVSSGESGHILVKLEYCACLHIRHWTNCVKIHHFCSCSIRKMIFNNKYGLLSNTYCVKIYCNGRSNSHLIISGVLQTFTIYIITKHVLKAHDTLKHKKDESLGHLANYCI